MSVTPVMFPPGRAKLLTIPVRDRILGCRDDNWDRLSCLLGCVNSCERFNYKDIGIELHEFG